MSRFSGLVVLVVCLLLARSSSAVVKVYGVILDGPSESPPNTSLGTGVGTVTVDNVANTMRVQVTFQGLDGTTTACHIHAPTPIPLGMTAGVATTTPFFAGFPIGVKSGSYDNTLDLLASSSYNPSYVSANGGTPASAEAALLTAIDAQKSYLNIHSSTVGGGEIRGFLILVPEPGSIALLGLGGLMVLRRRQRTA